MQPVLYVYRCMACQHRGEERLGGDGYEGSPSMCSECGGYVELEWDGGFSYLTTPALTAQVIATARGIELPELPRRPEKYAYGPGLAVGTLHVQEVLTPHRGGFTVTRTVGLKPWYPITARANPAWMLWDTRAEAVEWMEAQGEALSDWPHWGGWNR